MRAKNGVGKWHRKPGRNEPVVIRKSLVPSSIAYKKMQEGKVKKYWFF